MKLSVYHNIDTQNQRCNYGNGSIIFPDTGARTFGHSRDNQYFLDRWVSFSLIHSLNNTTQTIHLESKTLFIIYYTNFG